jgi:cobaltochelatase CobN
MSELKTMSASIALLTHAPNDLTVLCCALAQMPADFTQVIGINLQVLESEAQMSGLLIQQLVSARIIVLRVLGSLGSVPGFAELLKHAQSHGQHLIAISGTGEPDPELAAACTVSVDVLHQTLTYFQAGGSINMAQLLRYLSDHFLLTGLGFEPALALPEHAIYHPDLQPDASVDDWLSIRVPERASVGIVFYRAHWISGNTRFVDALITALECTDARGRAMQGAIAGEKQGMNVLPVFTASLRAGGDKGNTLPTALSFFGSHQGTHIDVLINTTAFAMGEITPGDQLPQDGLFLFWSNLMCRCCKPSPAA